MSPATVRANVLAGWSEKASQFHVAADDTLIGAEIADPQRADGTGPTILLTRFARLAEVFGERASHAAASWLIGEDYDLAQLGPVGAAVTAARTLGGALHRLADNFEMLQDQSRLAMETNADTATISYRILDPSIWPRYHDALFSLGIIAKIIKLAAPDAMQSIEVGFECARRETGLSLSQGQLAFDCEANSIRIPAAMLDLAMPASDQPVDLKALSAALAERRRARPARERLEDIIFARLADGDIDQDRLAGQIGMSSRTMRRRLAEDDLSFQQLLDACRMRQAVFEFAARPTASIADIALRLGYAEHSTFTRAFSRWAGMPPQRYRAQVAAQVAAQTH